MFTKVNSVYIGNALIFSISSTGLQTDFWSYDGLSVYDGMVDRLARTANFRTWYHGPDTRYIYTITLDSTATYMSGNYYRISLTDDAGTFFANKD